MSYFIDSNIFLRVIVKEEERTFSECRLLLRNVETKKLRAFSSNIILAEVVWTLTSFYKLKKEKILTALEGIRGLGGLRFVDKFRLDTALSLYTKFPAKYIDCLIASIPEIYSKKWTIISYDRDFDKLDVVRVEPKETI